MELSATAYVILGMVSREPRSGYEINFCLVGSEMCIRDRLITIAASAHEIRSPVESSMSISRGKGRSETS